MERSTTKQPSGYGIVIPTTKAQHLCTCSKEEKKRWDVLAGKGIGWEEGNKQPREKGNWVRIWLQYTLYRYTTIKNKVKIEAYHIIYRNKYEWPWKKNHVTFIPMNMMWKYDSKSQTEVAYNNQGGHRLKKVSSNGIKRASVPEAEWIEQVRRG